MYMHCMQTGDNYDERKEVWKMEGSKRVVLKPVTMALAIGLKP